MLKKRILSIIEIIKKQKLDGVLVSSISNITYLTSFSGFSTVEREAFLLIARNKQYIITDGRYSEAVHKTIKNFELIERATAFPFEKILKKLSQKHKIKRLGIEEDNLTVSEHKLLSSCLNDLNHFNIADLRIIKDSNEIKLIEKACELGDKAFKYILKKIKPGITEKEVAFEIELFIKKHGADISFPPIVAFGKNSSIPHHQTSDQRLKTNSIVLLDFGVKLDNYCSDMTRAVFLGKATNEQKKIYRTVLETQKKRLNFSLPTSHFPLLIVRNCKLRMSMALLENISHLMVIQASPTPSAMGLGLKFMNCLDYLLARKTFLNPAWFFPLNREFIFQGLEG